jgi:hypothetical protein
VHPPGTLTHVNTYSYEYSNSTTYSTVSQVNLELLSHRGQLNIHPGPAQTSWEALILPLNQLQEFEVSGCVVETQRVSRLTSARFQTLNFIGVPMNQC